MTLEFKKGNKSRFVRCLLDTGSMRSYIGPDVIADLCDDNARLSSVDYEIKTFIGSQRKSFKQLSLGINIPDLYLIHMPMLVDDSLNLTFEVTEMNSVLKNILRHNYVLADTSYDLNFESNNDEIILEALLGSDVLQYFPTFELKSCMNGSCFFINDKVVPFGNCEHFLSKSEIENLNSQFRQAVVEDCDDTLVNLILDPIKSYFNPMENLLDDSAVDNGIENLFSLDNLGIKNLDSELADFDKYQISEFEKKITFKDNAYHIALPWYQDKIKQVPSNHKMALRILDKVYDDLKNKNLLKEYDDALNEQLKDNVIEELNVSPVEYENFVWIPHRAVVKTDPQVTNKVRPVFNCSFKAKKDDFSLNSAAYPGVDIMSPLLSCLLKFRTNEYVVLSDIRRAFLMIRLINDFDKSRFSFFWKKDDKLVTYCYKTIIFGFVSSPFILQYIMRFHASKYPDDKCSDILKNNFYVDNLIFTSNSLFEAKELYRAAFNRMKEGNFTLRSWCSNSSALNNVFKEDQNFPEHECEEEKVLGYKFKFERDVLCISASELNSDIETKRNLLSETAKVFDPLNFALPVTIKSRILLRHIWSLRPQVSWDDMLPDDIIKVSKKLIEDLKLLPGIEFPRFSISTDKTYALHICTDASSTCYGFVAYASDEFQSNFLFAKTKMAPVKKSLSIPSLELMGVALVFKCIRSILDAYKEVKFSFLNIAIDAQVVISWLLTNNLNVKSKFVANRIKDIKLDIEKLKHEYDLTVYFKYIGSSDNPADLVTKPLTMTKFKEKLDFYLHGPKFLTNSLKDWPPYELNSLPSEVKTLVNVNLNSTSEKKLFDMTKYSSLPKIRRILTIVTKFLSLKFDKSDKFKSLNLNSSIETFVETSIIKMMQVDSFEPEINFLQNNASGKKIPDLVNQLNLFIDSKGILRTKGRISKNSYLAKNLNCPVLLHKNHHLTKLLINDCHKRVQHLGVHTTLTALRNLGYWIPQGRQAVKKVLSDCYLCKKYNALAYDYPRYTNLPKHRMNLVYPFYHVGIDFFGPVWIYDPKNGCNVKMYVLIFTCLNIRAIDLHLLPDMSIKSFLLTVNRFCNTYTIPSYFYCDNAKTFQTGGKILTDFSKSLCSNEFNEFLTNNQIKFAYIPAYSAWYGAAYERLIGVVKKSLYKAIGRNKLDYYAMITLLSSIKNAVNSRPLTYRSNSDLKEIQAITPNSFLKLNYCSSLVIRMDDDDMWKDDPSAETLSNTLNLQEETFELFRKLWHEDYLISLREHATKLYQSKWADKVKVDDIVLIKHPNKIRPYWSLGRVTKLIYGDDDHVRSVEVLVKGETVLHSINHLYPMELSVTHSGNSQPVESDTSATSTAGLTSPSPSRPDRQAAIRFRQFIRDNLDDL